MTAPEVKTKLLETVSPGNIEKIRAAPVSVIVGMDVAFFEKLPQRLPQTDATFRR